MRKLIFWRGTALALILMGALALAHAADVNARISGTVTDPQGAVLPNIQVTLTNEATGVTQVTNTQGNGTYLFAQVPVGSYTVSVKAAGFKAYNAKGIVVTIDQQFVQPVQLQVGSTSEVIEVSASNTAQVDTTDMELSNVVSSEQIVELPLINRSFTGLELTLPGVQASSDRFGAYSVSGGQTQQSEYLINGADTNDIALNTVALNPNLDAIDQFNLIDGPLNAEYDRNSGGIVSATIKSGSNKFHGDAFEFYRDTFLNTLSFFQKNFDSATNRYDGKVSPYHQNIYGGTVGGPILHDKLFFFGAYQGTKQRTPDGSGQVDVLSTANRGGDFSVEDNGDPGATRPGPSDTWGQWSNSPIPASISIPGCAGGGQEQPETWAQCAYDLGGKFPSGAFNSVAANMLAKYVPGPSPGQQYLYNFNPVTTQSDNQYIARVDVAPNASNQIYFLYLRDKRLTTDTLPFTGATVPGFGDMSTLVIQQYTGDYVHQFNSSLVNDFSGHYTRFNYDAVEPQSKVDPASLGFAIHPENTAGEGVPSIGVGGNASNFTLGFSTNGPQPRIDQVAQLDDSISKVVGNHTFKFGYDGRRFNVHNPFSFSNNGAFSFGAGNTYSSGDGSLDFLMGVPGGYSQNSGAEIIAEAFLNYVYAQDTWKLTPTFTLSYGLGYSVDTPLHNLQYGGEAIVCIVKGEDSKIFPGAPTGWVYPGDPGCNNAGKATTRYSEFGPRVGFAWAPDLGALSGAPGKFSVRGGFGIYYDRSEEESALQTLATPPFGTSSSGFAGSPQFANPFADLNNSGTVENPFPYTFPSKGAQIDWNAQEAATGFNALYNVSTYGSDFRAPYAENFQLSVEREFPSHIVARASYVGSLARHNQSVTDANPITPEGHAACVADTTYCGNPAYSGGPTIYRTFQSYFFPDHTYLNNPAIMDVGQVDSGATSSYHSLQASVEKGVTHGLTFQLSYTWAHALDTGSSFENAGFGIQRGYNQFDTALNYGDSAFDVRHRLVFSPIYITPNLPGHANWYDPLNLMLSGWQVSGIMTFATGFPYDVSYAGGSADSLWCVDGTNFYACPDVPNQVAPIKVIGNPRDRLTGAYAAKGAYISKTDFANEPIGEFGNTHRNPAHGPGLNNTNMVLAKNIYFSSDRRMYVQMRMESDNVFNHTQFTNPSSTFGDTTLANSRSSFGYISGTQSARLTQLAAKIYF